MSPARFTVVVTGALLLALPGQAALLVNGGFEAVTAMHSLPPGWDGSTAAPGGPLMSPNLIVTSGADYIPCCGVTGSPAALANHFASFGAADAPNAGGVLAQSFTTVAGQSYLVGFDAAAFGVAGTQTLSVQINDLAHMTLTSLQTVTVDSLNDLDAAFTQFSFGFTATGGLAEIRFENISAVTDDIDAALDNVVISPRAGIDEISPVPEPATWLMLLAGYSCLALSLRRQRPSHPRLAGI